MASENPNDRRGHMLNGSALRLQPNEIGLVNHARKCMPGAEVCQGLGSPHFRAIVRSAVTVDSSGPTPPRRPGTIALPGYSPPGHRPPEIMLL